MSVLKLRVEVLVCELRVFGPMLFQNEISSNN